MRIVATNFYEALRPTSATPKFLEWWIETQVYSRNVKHGTVV